MPPRFLAGDLLKARGSHAILSVRRVDPDQYVILWLTHSDGSPDFDSVPTARPHDYGDQAWDWID